MAKKKGKRQGHDAEWARAKKLCRLSAEDVRMAKEMGLKPRKLVKNIPNKSEPWKAPVKVWIREMYRERREKAEEKARRKRTGMKDEGGGMKTPSAFSISPSSLREADVPADLEDAELKAEEFEEDELEDEFPWSDRRPGAKEIADENDAMLRRQEQFRIAAEYVARAMGEIPAVEKVVTFGSVVSPLKTEVPRFREFRRAGIEILHECKDVDLAVWVSDLTGLRALRKARSDALKALLAERNIGVAHHQVDVFVMEPDTDRYLGRLCTFAKCPRGKPECREPGCGRARFLQQHEGFAFDRAALERSETLYERGEAGDVEMVGDQIPF